MFFWHRIKQMMHGSRVLKFCRFVHQHAINNIANIQRDGDRVSRRNLEILIVQTPIGTTFSQQA